MKKFTEWLHEQGYDSWKLSSPDGWETADWSFDDLDWTDWEDDSQVVYLKNNKLFDSKSRELTWLNPVLEDLLNQSPSNKYWLEYQIKFGNHKIEDVQLALDIRDVKMTSEQGNMIQSSFNMGNLAGKIGSHFYPSLKFI